MNIVGTLKMNAFLLELLLIHLIQEYNKQLDMSWQHYKSICNFVILSHAVSSSDFQESLPDKLSFVQKKVICF